MLMHTLLVKEPYRRPVDPLVGASGRYQRRECSVSGPQSSCITIDFSVLGCFCGSGYLTILLLSQGILNWGEHMQHLRSSQLALLPALALALVACGTTPDFHAKIASTIHPLVAGYRVGSKEDGQAFVEFGTDTAYGRQTSLYDIKAGTTIP